MSKNKPLIIGLTALIILIGGVFANELIKNRRLENELALNSQSASEKIALLKNELKTVNANILKKEKELRAVKTQNFASHEKDAKGSELVEGVKTPLSVTHDKQQEEEGLTAQEELLANLFELETAINPEISESQTKEGPLLSVNPKTLDLGEISKANGPATGTYTLKNEGDKPVTISYVFSSCGCTTTPLEDDKVLQPQEEFRLGVTYDPNYYGSNFGLGPVEKTVTVISNDSERPFYKVKLRANVTP